jgi:predicted transglutaminase-like cysteine proteinase
VLEGYTLIRADADDPVRLRWTDVRSHFYLSRYVPPITLSWHAISERNRIINSAVRPAANPSGRWQTPNQTMSGLMGDAVDIAVLKYATLLCSRVPESDLCLVLCADEPRAYLLVEFAGLRAVLDAVNDTPCEPCTYRLCAPRYALMGCETYRVETL